jgi:hypothetical protein
VGDTVGTPAPDVAYENVADRASATAALGLYEAGLLQVQAFDTEGVVSAQVWGTCPRCGHDLDVQLTLSVPIIGVRGERGLWAGRDRRGTPDSPGIPDTVEVGCGCGRAHPGAPENVTGCGVSFRLPTSPPDAPAVP